jgi:hypothetical protein
MSGVYLETLEGDEEHSHDFYIPGPNAGREAELGRWFGRGVGKLFKFNSRAFLPRQALNRMLPKGLGKKLLPPAKKTGMAKVMQNVNKGMRTLEQIQDQLPAPEESVAPEYEQTDFSSFTEPRYYASSAQQPVPVGPVAMPDEEYEEEYDEELSGFDFVPGEGAIVEELDGDFGFSAIASAALPALKTAASSALTSSVSNLFKAKKKKANPLQKYLPLILAQQSQAKAASAQRSAEPVPVYSSQQATQNQTTQTNQEQEKQWYQKPMVWAGIGAGTAATGTLIYLATRK